jgi:hypothetical protein
MNEEGLIIEDVCEECGHDNNCDCCDIDFSDGEHGTQKGSGFLYTVIIWVQTKK